MADILPGQKLRIAVNAKYQGIAQDVGYEISIDTKAKVADASPTIKQAKSKKLTASLSPADVSFQWDDITFPNTWPANTLLSVHVSFWCGTDQAVCGSFTWEDVIKVVGSGFSGYGISVGNVG